MPSLSHTPLNATCIWASTQHVIGNTLSQNRSSAFDDQANRSSLPPICLCEASFGCLVLGHNICLVHHLDSNYYPNLWRVKQLDNNILNKSSVEEPIQDNIL